MRIPETHRRRWKLQILMNGTIVVSRRQDTTARVFFSTRSQDEAERLLAVLCTPDTSHVATAGDHRYPGIPDMAPEDLGALTGVFEQAYRWDLDELLPKVTGSMLRALRALAEGREPYTLARNRSQAGGLSGTFHALRRLGLIDATYQPTQLGLDVIQSYEHA